MPIGVLIPGFDDEREAAKDAFGGIEIVGVLLEPHERRHACLQFLGIERLADEVVGAGLEAANLVLARVQAGDERDGDQSRLGRLLQSGADLESVDAGHLDVEQHEIDVTITKRGDGFGARRHRHDFIATVSSATARATRG